MQTNSNIMVKAIIIRVLVYYSKKAMQELTQHTFANLANYQIQWEQLV